MEIDDVFLLKLQDIAQRCGGVTYGWTGMAPHVPRNPHLEYELIMAAPLLREMLFGSPRPLMDMVNGPERKMKIYFRVAHQIHRPPKPPPPGYDFAGPAWRFRVDGLVPMPEDRRTPQAFNRDRFLREPVITRGKESYTVRDVIDYTANAAGAVHFGDPSTGEREALKRFDQAVTVGDVSSTAYTLRGIGAVTVLALSPLADRVVADRQ